MDRVEKCWFYLVFILRPLSSKTCFQPAGPGLLWPGFKMSGGGGSRLRPPERLPGMAGLKTARRPRHTRANHACPLPAQSRACWAPGHTRAAGNKPTLNGNWVLFHLEVNDYSPKNFLTLLLKSSLIHILYQYFTISSKFHIYPKVSSPRTFVWIFHVCNFISNWNYIIQEEMLVLATLSPLPVPNTALI